MSVPIPPQPTLTPEQWGQRFGAWQAAAAALATAKTPEVIERKALAGYYFPQLDGFDGGGQRIGLGNGSDLRGEVVTRYTLKPDAFHALSDAGKATALQLIATLFTSEKSVKLHIVPTSNEPPPYKLPERSQLAAAAAAPAPGAPMPPAGFPAPPMPHAGANVPPPMAVPGMPAPNAAPPMPTPGAQSATLPPQQPAKPARAPRKPRAAAAPAAADPAPPVDAWITTPAANGASYAQLVGMGWTHEALLQHGLVQPNPAAAPPAPPAPPAPSAAAAPVYAMTASAGGYSREEMLSAGWTDENLIAAGHMVLTNATAAAPAAPKPATRGRGRPRKTT